MAEPRRKPRKERLDNLERSKDEFSILIRRAGDNAPPDICKQFEIFVLALADAQRDLETDYADDSLLIATSAQQQLTHLTVETGFLIRSSVIKAGKAHREINDDVEDVLEFARTLLPANGPPYDRGVPAKIIRAVSKKFKRTESSTRQLLKRYKIFE